MSAGVGSIDMHNLSSSIYLIAGAQEIISKSQGAGLWSFTEGAGDGLVIKPLTSETLVGRSNARSCAFAISVLAKIST